MQYGTPADAEFAPGNKGLKAGALGYASNLVIAIASTAPAYSLAATLGFVVAVGGIGVHAPAVLIVSFIPILFVSVGYRFFKNKADIGVIVNNLLNSQHREYPFAQAVGQRVMGMFSYRF